MELLLKFLRNSALYVKHERALDSGLDHCYSIGQLEVVLAHVGSYLLVAEKLQIPQSLRQYHKGLAD